jgi:hypothetical protein
VRGPDIGRLLAFHVELLEIQERRIAELEALLGVPVQEWEEHAHGELRHAHFVVPAAEHDHVEAA